MRKVHVGLRLEQFTLDQVDAMIPQYSGPGVEATRSDVLRALVLVGIKAHERVGKKSAKERADVAKKAGAT